MNKIVKNIILLVLYILSIPIALCMTALFAILFVFSWAAACNVDDNFKPWKINIWIDELLGKILSPIMEEL